MYRILTDDLSLRVGQGYNYLERRSPFSNTQTQTSPFRPTIENRAQECLLQSKNKSNTNQISNIGNDLLLSDSALDTDIDLYNEHSPVLNNDTNLKSRTTNQISSVNNARDIVSILKQVYSNDFEGQDKFKQVMALGNGNKDGILMLEPSQSCKFTFVNSNLDLHKFFDVDLLGSLSALDRSVHVNDRYSKFLRGLSLDDDRHSYLALQAQSHLGKWQFDHDSHTQQPKSFGREDQNFNTGFLQNYGDSYIEKINFGRNALFLLKFKLSDFPFYNKSSLQKALIRYLTSQTSDSNDLPSIQFQNMSKFESNEQQNDASNMNITYDENLGKVKFAANFCSNFGEESKHLSNNFVCLNDVFNYLRKLHQYSIKNPLIMDASLKLYDSMSTPLGGSIGLSDRLENFELKFLPQLFTCNEHANNIDRLLSSTKRNFSNDNSKKDLIQYSNQYLQNNESTLKNLRDDLYLQMHNLYNNLQTQNDWQSNSNTNAFNILSPDEILLKYSVEPRKAQQNLSLIGDKQGLEQSQQDQRAFELTSHSYPKLLLKKENKFDKQNLPDNFSNKSKQLRCDDYNIDIDNIHKTNLKEIDTNDEEQIPDYNENHIVYNTVLDGCSELYARLEHNHMDAGNRQPMHEGKYPLLFLEVQKYAIPTSKHWEKAPEINPSRFQLFGLGYYGFIPKTSRSLQALLIDISKTKKKKDENSSPTQMKSASGLSMNEIDLENLSNLRMPHKVIVQRVDDGAQTYMHVEPNRISKGKLHLPCSASYDGGHLVVFHPHFNDSCYADIIESIFSVMKSICEPIPMPPTPEQAESGIESSTAAPHGNGPKYRKALQVIEQLVEFVSLYDKRLEKLRELGDETLPKLFSECRGDNCGPAGFCFQFGMQHRFRRSLRDYIDNYQLSSMKSDQIHTLTKTLKRFEELSQHLHGSIGEMQRMIAEVVQLMEGHQIETSETPQRNGAFDELLLSGCPSHQMDNVYIAIDYLRFLSIALEQGFRNDFQIKTSSQAQKVERNLPLGFHHQFTKIQEFTFKHDPEILSRASVPEHAVFTIPENEQHFFSAQKFNASNPKSIDELCNQLTYNSGLDSKNWIPFKDDPQPDPTQFRNNIKNEI